MCCAILRTLHAVSELQRLSPFSFEEILDKQDDSDNHASAAKKSSAQASIAIDVLVGSPGSGLKIVQSLFRSKLAAYYRDNSEGQGCQVHWLDIDFCAFVLRMQQRNRASEAPEDDASKLPEESDVMITHGDVVDYLDSTVQTTLREIERNSNSHTRQVLFVTVTMSPLVHVKCCDLWTMLSVGTGGRVVNVTAIVTPDTFSQRDNTVNTGLGFECWRAAQRETLCTATASVVVLLESSSSSPVCAAVKDLLAVTNPAAIFLRVHPGLPTLAPADFEHFASRMNEHFAAIAQSNSDGRSNGAIVGEPDRLSEREAFLFSLGYPAPQQLRMIGRNLRHHVFQTLLFPMHVAQVPQTLRVLQLVASASDIQYNNGHNNNGSLTNNGSWALSSVLSLLTLLFPKARTATFQVTQHWQQRVAMANELESQDQPGSFFQRLVRLASAKVLAENHASELQKAFQQRIHALTRQSPAQLENLAKLQSGALSVVVHLTLRGESLSTSATSKGNATNGRTKGSVDQTVVIEANAAFITMREVADSAIESVSTVDHMVVHGVFSSTQLSLLRQLVKACAKHRMRRQPPLQRSDFSDIQCQRIQRQQCFRERVLPSGWWFDGQHFVNFHGVIRALRPDIDEIMVEYLTQRNIALAQHNALLDLLDL